MSTYPTENAVIYKSLALVGYPNHRIGSDASIWSSVACTRWGYSGAWRKLHTLISRKGYEYVTLCKDNKKYPTLVHRLMLIAFVGPCPEGQEACHKDGNRSNNNLDNLRWDTHVNNEKDKIEHGTLHKGEAHYLTKLTDDDIRKIRAMYKTGKYTQTEIAELFWIDHTNVSIIVCRKGWKHVQD